MDLEVVDLNSGADNSREKKLLFITTRLFFPPESGRKLSLYHYCRGLHKVCGYKIYLYSFLDSSNREDEANAKPDFIETVYLANKVGSLAKLKNILFNSLFGKRQPFQCSLYVDERNMRRISQLIASVKPSAIIVDMIRLAPYFKAFAEFPCAKILDMDDLLSKRYERQVAKRESRSDFTGQYGKGGNRVFRAVVNLSPIKKWILLGECARLVNYEKYYTYLYDKVILVSQKETDILNSELPRPKAITVAVGCDLEYFASKLPVAKKPNTLSFVGNMNSAQGSDAVDMIITRVLPKIKAKVTLKIFGKCPEGVMNRYKFNENVVFTGYVDDLRIPVAETEVFLAPIPYGSGIKTKIIEAMAMGMPVVTNSIGAEGINAVNGTHLFIEDDFYDMAKLVDFLLRSRDKALEIGANAKKLIQDEYQWEKIWASFADAGL
ncbi:MAG: glycosyltransferase family 4 protein [Clostridiales bacterium]|jgi:glycosyltransferase involved in cell wall biosynthesis|nr:glycosyltransferase family 4 protein [Clostridiales bacterium]